MSTQNPKLSKEAMEIEAMLRVMQWSQSEAARRARCSPSMITAILKGERNAEQVWASLMLSMAALEPDKLREVYADILKEHPPEAERPLPHYLQVIRGAADRLSDAEKETVAATVVAMADGMVNARGAGVPEGDEAAAGYEEELPEDPDPRPTRPKTELRRLNTGVTKVERGISPEHEALIHQGAQEHLAEWRRKRAERQQKTQKPQ